MSSSTPFVTPVAATETSTWIERKSGGIVAFLLLLSFGLRIWLAATGGQDFWPDEARYSAGSREAAALFARGATREAWTSLIGKADHLFFKIAGVPMAWWELKHQPSPVLVAVYFGMFSVLSLWLIYGIARRAGAGKREAAVALFFAAGASSLFYYCRHFFPYDLSLFFCLLALWFALGPRAWWGSLLAGLAAGFGFLSYNGYWLLAGAVLTWHVLSARSWRMGASRAGCAGLGLLAPLVAAGWGAHVLGCDLIASFRNFSGTITQGDFGRGHVFVWQYLWDTEGLLFAVWSMLAIAGFWRVAGGTTRARWWLWIGAIVVLYLGLVVCADGLKTFVVYGRTARILVPFFCLAAAAASDGILFDGQWPRWAWASLLTGIGVLASLHLGRAIQQVFPMDFMVAAARLARTTGTRPHGLLRVLNAERLGELQVMREPRPHATLLRRPHPYQFRPYLYEGFSEAQRRGILTEDVAMQLIELTEKDRDQTWSLPSTACRLQVRFPKNRTGMAEPLLTGGTSQQANFIYVQYLDETHVRFGFDVWGVQATLSRGVELDYSAEHELFLCGGLIASSGEAQKIQAPGDLLVVLDGEVLLSGRRPSNVVDPASVFIGMNFVGGSSCGTSFTGPILESKWLSPRDVRPFLAERSLEGLRDEPVWGGYTGPIRLKIDPMSGSGATVVPLLTTGREGARDRLFLVRNSDGELRLCFAPLAATAVDSDPVSEAELRDVVVVQGSCFPPLGKLSSAAIYPAWRAERLNVLAGDRLVLRWDGPLQPTEPEGVVLGGNALSPDGTLSRHPGVWLEAEKLESGSLPQAVAQIHFPEVAGGSGWQGYPGALRMRVRFGADRAGLNEPLVVTGVTGFGDFIFVRHLGGGRIAIGHDHWGTGGSLSETVSVEEGQEHELVVSSGGLFPPDPAAPCYQAEPLWRKLRGRCVVLLDGKVLLAGPAETHPNQSEQIYAGMNPIGGSSTERLFSGEIISIERAPAARLEAATGAP